MMLPVKAESGTVTSLVPLPVALGMVVPSRLFGSVKMTFVPSVLIVNVSSLSPPSVSSTFKSLPSRLIVVVARIGANS